MTCEEVRALLPAYLDGEASRSAEVAWHLSGCEACRAELAGYRSMVRSLAGLREGGAVPGAHLAERVIAAIPAPSLGGRLRISVSDHPVAYAAWLGVATAAVLILWLRARPVRPVAA